MDCTLVPMAIFSLPIVGTGNYLWRLFSKQQWNVDALQLMSYSLYTMNPDTIRIHGTSNLIYTVPFVMYGVFRYIFLLIT